MQAVGDMVCIHFSSVSRMLQHTCDMRKAKTIVVGNPEVRTLGSPKRRWMVHIEIDLKEIEYYGVDRIIQA